MKKQLVLTIFITLILKTGFCQKLNFEKVLLTNGLDSTLVNIFSDNYGKEFALSSNLEIFEYKNSKFYSKRKIEEIQFSRYTTDFKKIEIQDIIIDNQNNIWLTFSSTNKFFLFSKPDFEAIYKVNLNSYSVENLIENESLYKLIDGKVVSKICFDGNKMYMATNGNGLIQINSDNSIVKYCTYNSKILDNSLTDIQIGQDGSLWLGSITSGLLNFKPNQNECESFNKDNTKIPSNFTKSINTTNKNSVFFETEEVDDDLFQLKNGEVKSLFGDGITKLSGVIHKFVADKNENIFLIVGSYGNDNNSLVKINNGNMTVYSSKDYPFLNDEIKKILLINNNLWVIGKNMTTKIIKY